MRQFLRSYGRVIALLMVVAVAAVLTLILHGSGQREESRRACDILTPPIARVVAGQAVTRQQPNAIDAKDSRTTFCVYRGRSSTVALVVRTAKTKAGNEANQSAFTNPALSSQRVTGYGDSAYWVPSFGQLNILENGTWYIMNAGPSKPADRTLKESTDLARQLRL